MKCYDPPSGKGAAAPRRNERGRRDDQNAQARSTRLTRPWTSTAPTRARLAERCHLMSFGRPDTSATWPTMRRQPASRPMFPFYRILDPVPAVHAISSTLPIVDIDRRQGSAPLPPCAAPCRPTRQNAVPRRAGMAEHRPDSTERRRFNLTIVPLMPCNLATTPEKARASPSGAVVAHELLQVGTSSPTSLLAKRHPLCRGSTRLNILIEKFDASLLPRDRHRTCPV